MDSRVFTQAVRSLNDGVSLLNVAEGALRELLAISHRLMELAERSANGIYASAQREALYQEAAAPVDEHHRILSSTSCNNMRLLDGSSPKYRLHAGVDGILQLALIQTLVVRASPASLPEMVPSPLQSHT